MYTWQQELGLRRSEIAIDGKNFDNERCHDPHNINRNQITVRKVSCDTKNGVVRPPRADGWCSDSDNEIDFRFPFAGGSSRGGGIEQCSISQPRDEMHSYSPSTQALLRMLLLGPTPAAEPCNVIAGRKYIGGSDSECALRLVLTLIFPCRQEGRKPAAAVLI